MTGRGQQARLGGNEAAGRVCLKGKTEVNAELVRGGGRQKVSEEMLGVKSL